MAEEAKRKLEMMLKDKRTFVKAESAELKQVKRKIEKKTEVAPMLVLRDVAVLTVHDQRILDAEFKASYGVWLELLL